MYKSWVKPPLWNLAGLIFKWGGIFLSFEVGNCVSNANFKWKESNEALKELIKPHDFLVLCSGNIIHVCDIISYTESKAIFNPLNMLNAKLF